MELDDFKTHWNLIQEKEFQQQKLSTEEIQQIMINTTDTLSQMHQKSVYWRNVGKPIIQVLIATLAVVFLIILLKGIYQHKLTNFLISVAYLGIMVLYGIITMWLYKRQEQIFTVNRNGNVKETLKQTITAFKRFYLKVNIIYLFLYPAYFYAIIKLLISYWHPSAVTITVTCAAATMVSLIGGHWYYKVRFLKKLKSLEDNLRLLESE